MNIFLLNEMEIFLINLKHIVRVQENVFPEVFYSNKLKKCLLKKIDE